MCGVVGIAATSNVRQYLFDAITVLQHRGQDAAGIATQAESYFFLRKGKGLVRDVFRTRHMQRLKGTSGIAHVRYPTSGSASSAEAQPLYVNSPYGITLAHNGSLTNSDEIKQELFRDDLRHINTHSDSEILLNVLASELSKQGKIVLDSKSLFFAIAGVYRRCEGGYAVVAMINGYGLLGFRDPYGIRPLVYGKRIMPSGTEYMLASESVALTAIGFEFVRDVEPGEVIYIDQYKQLHTFQCVKGIKYPCIFEYIYLSRPDSTIDGISVYESRLRMGQALSNRVSSEWSAYKIDVVIPIPDTSRSIALEMANRLNIPYREGFVKNRYIGRTFIMPGQAVREKSVMQKLSVIAQEFSGKNVLIVDDSIVRGTTCKQIIEMARKAGAKKVYFCSAAPPVRYPNVYGIDMPTRKELIAYDRTESEVEKLIGADRLIYQNLVDTIALMQSLNKKVMNFDCSIFNGNYIAGSVNDEYLEKLAEKRILQREQISGEIADVIDLYDEADDSGDRVVN